MNKRDENPDDLSPDTGDISQDCSDNNHDECDGTLSDVNVTGDCECPCHLQGDDDLDEDIHS